MWVKAPAVTWATLKRSGLAALYTDRLRHLKNVYAVLNMKMKWLPYLITAYLISVQKRLQSIRLCTDFFLFKHIDHLHPDAAIAIAASKDVKHYAEIV